MASSASRVLVKILDGEVAATRAFAQGVAKTLREAIDNYTDNVAPPDVMAERGAFKRTEANGILPLDLWMRDLLPDEIDEDPPQGVRGDTAIELLADMRTELRELIVQELDADFSDEQAPTVAAVRARVCDLKELVSESERTLQTALQQMGKETIARINAERQVTAYEAHQKARAQSAAEFSEGVQRVSNPPGLRFHGAGGMTAEELAAGFAKLPKAPALPDFDAPAKELALGARLGNKIVGGVLWFLDRLP